jgi:thiopurine S-methyltransferase
MEKAFWLDKWQRNEIGFHNPEAHPLLVKHFPKLGLGQGARLFLPLCGKTLDIGWLLGQGFRVVGAELSEMAVVQLFEQLGVAPEISEHGVLKRYRAQDIDIYVGDIFHLQQDLLGEVDGIYDRAALVALPEPMRREYAKHLQRLTRNTQQLLITFDYDQTQLPGPPFCVSDGEVAQLYGDHYQLTLIDAVEVPGRLKGRCEALEKVWLLAPAV